MGIDGMVVGRGLARREFVLWPSPRIEKGCGSRASPRPSKRLAQRTRHSLGELTGQIDIAIDGRRSPGALVSSKAAAGLSAGKDRCTGSARFLVVVDQTKIVNVPASPSRVVPFGWQATRAAQDLGAAHRRDFVTDNGTYPRLRLRSHRVPEFSPAFFRIVGVVEQGCSYATEVHGGPRRQILQLPK